MAKKRKYRIDACSFIDFVIFLLHFDKEGILYNFMKKGLLDDRNLILNSRIYEEVSRERDGIVLEKLDFLKDAPQEPKLIPPPWLDKRVRKNWIRQDLSHKMTERRYEKQLGTGDFHIIGCSIIGNQNDETCENIVVTEEHPGPSAEKKNNSRNLYKKVPEICDDEGVRWMNMATMLEEQGISATFRYEPPGNK